MDYGDRSDNFHTSDGVEITPNLRVFGYDMEWGNVEPLQFGRTGPTSIRFGQFFDGWYTVVWDSGKTDIANGTRMAHRTPLSTDPNPDKVIDKDGNVECRICLSVTMGICMDGNCNCHHKMAFDSDENERELWFGTPDNPIL